MAKWTRIASARDCPPGESRELVVGNRIVALYNVQGQFYALDGICPHQGGPLGQGSLDGCMVTCPWHGWRFDVCSGQHQTNESVKHTSFPVKLEGDEVFVDLSD